MYPDVEREARRHVSRHGEKAVVYNYSQTGTDEYGDPTFSESSETTRMLFSVPGGGTSDKGVEGQKDVKNPSIRIPDTVTVHPPEGSNPKATVIERSKTGEQFKIQSVVDDRTGVYQILAEGYDNA